jgi:hypothetical protein
VLWDIDEHATTAAAGWCRRVRRLETGCVPGGPVSTVVPEQLESAVEGSAGHHVERDIGIPVIDPVAPGAPGDHREDDHAESVDQDRLDERLAQG